MGGSSGGGSSGAVSWPAYMQACHSSWLNHAGADTVSKSVTTTMNEAFGRSPFAEQVVWEVAKQFGTQTRTCWELFDDARNIDILATFDRVVASVTRGSIAANLLRSVSEVLDEDLEMTVLPRFKSSMRDINCALSSAFVIGEGLIETSKQKQLTRVAAEIDMKLLEMSERILGHILDWQKNLVHQGVEISRIFLAARFDELKFNTETLAKDRLWDLRVWEYGAHVMSSISGGTANQNNEESSQVANVLGGAMSGAAAGAQIGNYMGGSGAAYGAAIGAVVGGVAGAFR